MYIAIIALVLVVESEKTKDVQMYFDVITLVLKDITNKLKQIF